MSTTEVNSTDKLGSFKHLLLTPPRTKNPAAIIVTTGVQRIGALGLWHNHYDELKRK